jgi:hypothetical protein
VKSHVTVDSLDLISGARDLLRLEGSSSVGLWSRAAAVVARQGLEAALDELWARRCPGLQETSARCQLACLPFFLEDEALAQRAETAWANLSATVHYAGELPQLPSEVEAWLSDAWQVANAVQRITV